MSVTTRRAYHAAVMLAWVGSMFFVAYDVENTTEDRILFGVIVTFVAGLLSGRWWTLAVPPLFSAGLLLWWVATSSSQDTSFSEISWALVLFAISASVLVGLGVLVHRVGAWAYRRVRRAAA